MKIINDNLNVLCFGNEDSVNDFYVNLCEVVLEDVDVLANSIIGDSVSRQHSSRSSTSLTLPGTVRGQQQLQLSRILWSCQPPSRPDKLGTVMRGRTD